MKSDVVYELARKVCRIEGTFKNTYRETDAGFEPYLYEGVKLERLRRHLTDAIGLVDRILEGGKEETA